MLRKNKPLLPEAQQVIDNLNADLSVLKELYSESQSKRIDVEAKLAEANTIINIINDSAEILEKSLNNTKAINADLKGQLTYLCKDPSKNISKDRQKTARVVSKLNKSNVEIASLQHRIKDLTDKLGLEKFNAMCKMESQKKTDSDEINALGSEIDVLEGQMSALHARLSNTEAKLLIANNTITQLQQGLSQAQQSASAKTVPNNGISGAVGAATQPRNNNVFCAVKELSNLIISPTKS